MNASVGYYYQHRDQEEVDGSGALGRLAYEMTSGVTAGLNLSYDEAFDTRVSADLKVRFGGASTTAQRKEVQQLPVINALTSTPSNRDVRAHDDEFLYLTKEVGVEIFDLDDTMTEATPARKRHRKKSDI